jgi:predicted DNA-binding transcriptional regulator YafY
MPPTPPLPRIERLDLLARMLRDRPGRTAADLAETLGVSPRSVARDIDLLRERGLPIEGARGRGGGLRLHPNWGVSRVLLSTEEALCTLLAMAVAERLSFPIFPDEVSRVRKKIVDAFPERERRRIAPLRERVFVGANASATVRASYGAPPPEPMRLLQAAFVEQRVVWLTYTGERSPTTTRRIEPHALVINWPAWYLLAYDHLRAAPRTFRFDRMLHVEFTIRRFQPRPNEMARELLGAEGIPLERV